MTEKHFILATAGHVDHGKSALVKALTGIDPDRLPEEKARQITIELGFTQLIISGPNEQRFHIGIVDVPGHEDFVRNMIAGVGSIDLALFVVAADDGWMPQTEEHLQILTYRGVERAVIALTKSDLGDAGSITAQVRERLHDTAFARSPIIPTSVRARVGVVDHATTTRCRKTAPVYRPHLHTARNRHGRDRHAHWRASPSRRGRGYSAAKFRRAHPLDPESWLRGGARTAGNAHGHQPPGRWHRRRPGPDQARRRNHRCRSFGFALGKPCKQSEFDSGCSSRKIAST